jgi:hypothetical protein
MNKLDFDSGWYQSEMVGINSVNQPGCVEK